jgi:hypothetical protein
MLIIPMLVLASGCGSSTGSSPSTQSSTQASSSAITGFGATDTAWNEAHTPVPGFTPGAVYDADPSLPKVNGHTGARYTVVEHDNGYVLGYVYHFANAPISAAKADVLRTQLPFDARVVWFARKDTCAQMMVRSAKLAQTLGPMPIGDKAGTVLVEFNSGANEDTYDPRSVNDAYFIALPLESSSQVPGCLW